MTQYLVTYQKLRRSENGSTKAIAVVCSPSYYDSSNRNGSKAQKCEQVEKVRIVGPKDDVWEVVDRMLGTERIAFLDLMGRASSVKRRSDLPTVHPSIFDKWINQDGTLYPHSVIAAAQLHEGRTV